MSYLYEHTGRSTRRGAPKEEDEETWLRIVAEAEAGAKAEKEARAKVEEAKRKTKEAKQKVREQPSMGEAERKAQKKARQKAQKLAEREAKAEEEARLEAEAETLLKRWTEAEAAAKASEEVKAKDGSSPLTSPKVTVDFLPPAVPEVPVGSCNQLDASDEFDSIEPLLASMTAGGLELAATLPDGGELPRNLTPEFLTHAPSPESFNNAYCLPSSTLPDHERAIESQTKLIRLEEEREKERQKQKAREARDAERKAQREEWKKLEAERRKEAKRREREEAQLKIQEEEERRAKEEEERRLKAEEERKAKEEEELRLKEKAERKARAREEAIARRQARRKEKEERDAQLKSEAEAKARAEAERKAREEEERRTKETEERQLKEEAERKARLEAEAEAEAKARAEEQARQNREAERRAREEAERKAAEEERVRLRAEAERKAREEAALKAKLEAEREAREKEELRIRDEKERKAKEEERRLKDEAERKAQEERKAKEEEERRLKEAERKAREAEEARLKAEAEAKAKAEEEARLKEEAERRAKEEAERKAKAEEEARLKEEAERRAKEEAERKAKEEEEARLKAEAEAKAREEAKARAKAGAEAAEAAAKANEEAEARRTPSCPTSPEQTNNLLRSIVLNYPSSPSLNSNSSLDPNDDVTPGELSDGPCSSPSGGGIGPEPRERDTSYPSGVHDGGHQSVGSTSLGDVSMGAGATPVARSAGLSETEDGASHPAQPFQLFAPLVVSENRWVGESMPRTRQKIQDLLNKLTTDNFDSISHRIIQYADRSEKVDDGSILMQVVKLVFASARNDSIYGKMYARLCHKMTERLSPNIRDETTQGWDEQVTTGGTLFRKYLLTICQVEFQRGWSVKGNGLALVSRDKRQGLGLVRFMGELFRFQMLTERIVHNCIKKLLSDATDPKEDDAESLCELLKTVGRTLDNPKARNQMDTYFERIREMANKSSLSWRIRFMLLDMIELRTRHWQDRSPGN